MRTEKEITDALNHFLRMSERIEGSARSETLEILGFENYLLVSYALSVVAEALTWALGLSAEIMYVDPLDIYEEV